MVNEFYIPSIYKYEDIRYIVKRRYNGRGNIDILTLGLITILDYFSQKYLSRQDDYGEIKIHHSKQLRKMINHRHSKWAMNCLVGEGILKKVRSHVEGQRSTSYKFAEVLLNAGFEKVCIQSNRGSYFDRNYEIDLKSLLASKNQIIRTTVENILRLQVPDYSVFKNYSLSDFQKSSWQYLLEKLASKSIYCLFDRFGRLHSNFTNLPRKIRARLSVGNEGLCNLDIKACFPTLLWSFINFKKEKERYYEILSSGGFYEYFMREIGYPITPELRQGFKKDFNSWINGKPFPEINDVMKRQFPVLFCRIKNIQKKDRRELGYKLMKLEAKIMLQTVLQEFWERKPSTFALSLHDALYFESESCDILVDGVEKAFQQHVGIKPRIEISRKGCAANIPLVA